MTPSAHLDSFARDNLPPRAQWPDFLFELPELKYPDRMNCAVDLLDRWIATGHGDRPCLISPAENLSYAQLAERVNRIANVLTHDLGLVPGHRVEDADVRPAARPGPRDDVRDAVAVHIAAGHADRSRESTGEGADIAALYLDGGLRELRFIAVCERGKAADGAAVEGAIDRAADRGRAADVLHPGPGRKTSCSHWRRGRRRSSPCA